MKDPIAFFVFQRKNLFIPLRFVYGECFPLIADRPQLSPLQCLQTTCPVNAGCMDILAKRVNYLFTQVVPAAELLIAYFKYPDRPNSVRAGIFYRDLREPRVMTLNKAAFKKFQNEGIAYTWIPPDEYLLMGPAQTLIPVESLLVRPND